MDAKQKAKDIIAELNISSFPIDIIDIIKKQDIGYLESKLPEDISGALDQRDKDNPYIIINSDHHIHRQRFSAAHELGHYFLHSKNGMHIDKKSFFRNSKSSEGIYEIEIEANKFAAELLMPTQFLLLDFDEFDDFLDSKDDMIDTLAKKYKVSSTAMSLKVQSILIEQGYSSF